MSYQIKKEGYEIKGVKLGQKCICKNEETIIIGFDNRDTEEFIAVKTKAGAGVAVTETMYMTHALDVAHNENFNYTWVKLSDIKLLEKEDIKMEKRMKKADLEGKWFKINKSNRNKYYKAGDIIQCKNSGLTSLHNVDTLFMWHHNLNKEFTLAELTNVLKTYYAGIGLEIVYLGDEPNQTSKKSKLSDVKVNVDMFFSKPIIEETKEEVFIFSGRVVTYFNKQLGVYGVAVCHEDELKSYSKEVGKALAYYRAFKSLDGGK